MKRSEETHDISEAYANAQAEMKNPVFDGWNPHFKSKFATLAAVRNAVIPVFAKHGLAVMQDLTTLGEIGVACTTIVQHNSGQWFEFGPFVVPTSKSDAQGYGSASTYARRYALMAVAGIVGDEDSDGAEVSQPQTPKKTVVADPDTLVAIREADTVNALQGIYKNLDEDQRAACLPAFTARRKELASAKKENTDV